MLFVVCCSLFVHCFCYLRVGGCLLSLLLVGCRLLVVVCRTRCLSFVAYCVFLFVDCCLQCVAHCLLFGVVRCKLFVVCWFLVCLVSCLLFIAR